MTPPSMTAPRWEDLAASALLGTDRRTPPVGVREGADAPEALLDAAALSTVRRRAGMLPAAAADLPEPAPHERRPPLPPAAARRLTQLLTGHTAPSGGRRGATPDLAELLPQWLAAANAHGYAAPATALPPLLDAARARTDLRAAAVEFAGGRGLWLARINPDWRFALRGSSGGVLLPALDDGPAVLTLWEEGLFAERVALLTAVREQDARRARELLASTWSTERAEDRLMFLDSLRAGLTAADEPFLADALGDRSRNVRSTAAELLSCLPMSALARRMAGRAASCVALDRTRSQPTIVVESPSLCDADMQRDGVVEKPPVGRGERSWWLGQLVAATPLATWTDTLGRGVRTPAEIIALPVLDEWADELRTAWATAAVRQRDVDWARALLDTPSDAGRSPADPARLLTILSGEERAEWVGAFIRTHGVGEAFQLLGVCPVPWPESLGGAVVNALDLAREAGGYPWSFSAVMGLAERCLDPSMADRLDGTAAERPDDRESPSSGADDYWSEAFRRLVSTLRLRALLIQELAGDTGTAAPIRPAPAP